MFGKNNVKVIDKYTAGRIAERMNHWAGENSFNQVITADEVLNLTPVVTSKPDGYLVYAYQYGDVTILACVRGDGRVVVKHTSW